MDLIVASRNVAVRQHAQVEAAGLDPRYVELSPVLYWLDRIGPIAARGRLPRAGWADANVLRVLDALVLPHAAEVTA